MLNGMISTFHLMLLSGNGRKSGGCFRIELLETRSQRGKWGNCPRRQNSRNFEIEYLAVGSFKVARGVRASRGKRTFYEVSLVWDSSMVIPVSCDSHPISMRNSATKEYALLMHISSMHFMFAYVLLCFDRLLIMLLRSIDVNWFCVVAKKFAVSSCWDTEHMHLPMKEVCSAEYHVVSWRLWAVQLVECLSHDRQRNVSMNDSGHSRIRHVSNRGDRCDGATDVLSHHQSNTHVWTPWNYHFQCRKCSPVCNPWIFIGFEGICKALPVMTRASQVRYLLESGESVRGKSE